MPSSEDNFPANSSPMPKTPDSPCRVAAQFNQIAGANAGMRIGFKEAFGPGVAQLRRSARGTRRDWRRDFDPVFLRDLCGLGVRFPFFQRDV
jgi:hypothetical protein